MIEYMLATGMDPYHTCIIMTLCCGLVLGIELGRQTK